MKRTLRVSRPVRICCTEVENVPQCMEYNNNDLDLSSEYLSGALTKYGTVNMLYTFPPSSPSGRISSELHLYYPPAEYIFMVSGDNGTQPSSLAACF